MNCSILETLPHHQNGRLVTPKVTSYPKPFGTLDLEFVSDFEIRISTVHVGLF